MGKHKDMAYHGAIEWYGIGNECVEQVFGSSWYRRVVQQKNLAPQVHSINTVEYNQIKTKKKILNK